MKFTERLLNSLNIVSKVRNNTITNNDITFFVFCLKNILSSSLSILKHKTQKKKLMHLLCLNLHVAVHVVSLCPLYSCSSALLSLCLLYKVRYCVKSLTCNKHVNVKEVYSQNNFQT